MKKFFIVMTLLPLMGVLFQSVWTWIDQYRFQPIGQRIDVNGQLFHYCYTGNGPQTVILDAGLGSGSLDWALIFPKIAEFTGVFSYDRAGYGWSDESSNPRTSDQMVEELHLLLSKAKIPKPYILVGHSLGGLNMQLYFSKYPDDVQGIVLVDSSHPEQLEKLPPEPEASILEKYPSFHILLAKLGVIRLIHWIPYVKNIIYETIQSFPLSLKEAYLAEASSTKYIRTFTRENELFRQSLNQVRERNISFGSTPLVVIMAGKESMGGWLDSETELLTWLQQSASIWQDLQRELLSRSSQSEFMIAEKSDHMIPRNQPEIVVLAIQNIQQRALQKVTLCLQ
jgi:pimeloyl-ACP methyl ester carboxylesterase